MSSIIPLRLNHHVSDSVRQINRSNLSAGMAMLLVYLFAGLPRHIGVLTQLGLSANEASSWFFITWMTTGLFSFGLAVFTRQPVSVNLSIPALIFLAGAAGGFSLPQIIGANLLVGLVAIGLSLFRVADSVSRLVPSQVAIGVFAGSMLLFILKTSKMATADLLISGPIIGGFILALAITRSQLKAVAVAAAIGLLAVMVGEGVPSVGNSVELPQFVALTIDFDPLAIISLGIPLLILVVGVGNIQSLAILRSEGYAVNGNILGLAAGVATLINALGGGHAAAIGGTTTPIGAGPAAGPSKYRFWAIVISSAPVVVIALAASPIIALVQGLPITYTLVVGALALVAPFKKVFEKTVEGPMRTKAAALTAFVVATLPFQLAGMPMAFWALVAGIVVSVLLSKRADEYWHKAVGLVASRYCFLPRRV